METTNDIRASIDNAKLMTRLSVISLIASLVLLVLTIIVSAVRGGNSISDVFSLAVIPYALSALFAASSLIYGVMHTAAAQENEEKMLLEKRKENRALDVEEDVRFTAGRSFSNFSKYAPYVLAVLGAAVVGLLLWHFGSSWNARATMPQSVSNALHLAVISFIMMLVSVFLGAFFIGQSRVRTFRWLRPAGAWLVVGFVVMGCATISAIFANSNQLKVDGYIAKTLFWLFAVLGAEFLINFVIEFYRPRTLKELRPIFESRLLALFTEPGGVMRNIASALDYQFGFKVSGTWLYSFVERSFFPMLLVWAAIFWGFTMLHEVGPSQVGVREVLGSVPCKQPLQPGIYWSLPWPFGDIKTFSCSELHEVTIGELHNDKDGKKQLSQVVLWTAAHGSDDNNFIVAVPPEGGKKESDGSSISFVRMVIPISYRIRKDGVMDYAYNNANPDKTLLHIGQQAATEYLASSPLMEVMSTGRSAAEQAMLKRIQGLADLHKLGVDIVSVTILDAHPPVEKVAPAYQNVIGALEEKETMILKAQSYAAKTVPAAQSAAEQIVEDAKAYQYTTRTVARAESERFGKQLTTYNMMPSMFKLKAYLEFLENDCQNVRKYVVSSSLRNEVYELNLEEKERIDLVDTDLTAVSQP